MVIDIGPDQVPYGIEGWLGSSYVAIGQPERMVDLCRAQLTRGRDTHGITRSCLAAALTMAGCPNEAITAATGLIDAAEATDNPHVLSFALLAHGFAFRDADPDRAREALRRGLVIARHSGNRANESHLAVILSQLEALHGDPLAAFEYVTLAIRNYHDSGDTINVRTPLAVLTAFFDRFGRYEPAAIIGGFAINPLATAAAVPELGTAIAHLRDVLGDQIYESLARKGETMTTAEMVAYVYDQIDQARTTLEHPS
jgi:hypothetical protein